MRTTRSRGRRVPTRIHSPLKVRPLSVVSDKIIKPRGLFHNILPEWQLILFKLGLEKRQEIHIQDLAELDVQRKEGRKKKKIAADIGIKRSQGKLIHSTNRHQQYKSTACMKGNPRKADQMMARRSTPTAKRRFLHAQIEMRLDGLGGEFADLFCITWSHQRKLRTVKFLSDHLQKILVAEVLMDIPAKPPTYLP